MSRNFQILYFTFSITLLENVKILVTPFFINNVAVLWGDRCMFAQKIVLVDFKGNKRETNVEFLKSKTFYPVDCNVRIDAAF